MEVIQDGWKLLLDKYYRKFELYRMEWNNISLKDHIVSGGQLGGPIGKLSSNLFS